MTNQISLEMDKSKGKMRNNGVNVSLLMSNIQKYA